MLILGFAGIADTLGTIDLKIMNRGRFSTK